MKAIVKTKAGSGFIEFKDWPEPSPVGAEVKLKVGLAGICGTDLHIADGNWPSKPPVVLGHEWCGTVVEAGPGVRGLKIGDRVLSSNPAKTCGRCQHCNAGNDFMCPERVSAGYMIDGAFADYICIDERRCHKLPDRVTFQAAALGEPLAVAVHAVIERTQVHSGDVALVLGPGCVGLLTAQVARLEGARVIIAGLSKDAARLERARALGIDHIVHSDDKAAMETVMALTDGRGADIVYECAGSANSLGMAWQLVKKEGTVVPLGMYAGPIQTDFNAISKKELRVIGTYGYVWTTWQRTVKLLATGKIDPALIVSHEYPLDRFQDAFEATRNGEAVKVVFNPNAKEPTIRR